MITVTLSREDCEQIGKALNEILGNPMLFGMLSGVVSNVAGQGLEVAPESEAEQSNLEKAEDIYTCSPPDKRALIHMRTAASTGENAKLSLKDSIEWADREWESMSHSMRDRITATLVLDGEIY